MSRPGADNRSEMIRRLRLGNLRKLFRDRYGPILPDDDAGREDLRELLLPISLSPHADLKMPKAIEVWAPWMQRDDAAQLVDDVKTLPTRRRMPTAKQLGKHLRVTNGERERLKLWTIAAYNINLAEARAWRRAKDRARKRLLRQLRGAKSRAEYEAASVNRTKPWIAAGISRRTWYRRGGTSCSEVRLRKAEDALVPMEKPQTLQGGRARTLAQASKSNTPTNVEKSQTSEQHTSTDVTDRQRTDPQMNGRTCANGWWRNAKTVDEKLDPDEAA